MSNIIKTINHSKRQQHEDLSIIKTNLKFVNKFTSKKKIIGYIISNTTRINCICLSEKTATTLKLQKI